LRGDQEKVFEVAHKLRDKKSWEVFGPRRMNRIRTINRGGSGNQRLSAAHFYRKQAGDKTRILILTITTILAGTRGVTSLKSAEIIAARMCGNAINRKSRRIQQSCKRRSERFGNRCAEFYQAVRPETLCGLKHRLFFRQRDVWRDKLAPELGSAVGGICSKNSVVSCSAERHHEAVCREAERYLAGKSKAQKVALLKSVSYSEYLTKYCGALRSRCHFLEWSHDLLRWAPRRFRRWDPPEFDDYGSVSLSWL